MPVTSVGERGMGSRRTKQRQVILEVVHSTKAHPDAYWVYEQVRQRLPRISLATVYRNLDLLTRGGAIQRLRAEGGYARYDGDVSNHSHISCRQCGRIGDVAPRFAVDLQQEPLRNTGFVDLTFRLDFSGLCADCAQPHR